MRLSSQRNVQQGLKKISRYSRRAGFMRVRFREVSLYTSRVPPVVALVVSLVSVVAHTLVIASINPFLTGLVHLSLVVTHSICTY
jgi:hypothetical protein